MLNVFMNYVVFFVSFRYNWIFFYFMFSLVFLSAQRRAEVVAERCNKKRSMGFVAAKASL
jgi:hypothetical protein